mmetsp:Transcript_11595/g.23422  ORF Transcript_11595/g.23422 Transcript_11595/m.23422 type:complete len:509 (-) Transcript_11595:42-1568(-)
MYSKFGRQFINLYEKRPLLMNSLVGGTVYMAGEYSAMTQEKDMRFFNEDDWTRLAQIGALGSAENGVIMVKWYSFLNKYIGNCVSTPVVLTKCLLDQIFYATQQDFMFLGLSAYIDADAWPEAVQEVKDTFLTTWIVDCALWPVVNFIGFAFIPYTIQPTYMAVISFFWQQYLSSTGKSGTKFTEKELETLFSVLDVHKTNYIDADELSAYFLQRDVYVSEEEIEQMILDADRVGREIHIENGGSAETVPTRYDGVVTLQEFKKLATHGRELELESAALWAALRQDVALTKGAKHAMKRVEGVQKHKKIAHDRKIAVEAADADADADAVDTTDSINQSANIDSDEWQSCELHHNHQQQQQPPQSPLNSVENNFCKDVNPEPEPEKFSFSTITQMGGNFPSLSNSISRPAHLSHLHNNNHSKSLRPGVWGNNATTTSKNNNNNNNNMMSSNCSYHNSNNMDNVNPSRPLAVATGGVNGNSAVENVGKKGKQNKKNKIVLMSNAGLRGAR